MSSRIIRSRRSGSEPRIIKPNPEKARILRRQTILAMKEAELLLNNTRVRANAILDEAEEKAEALRQRAIRSGRDEAAGLVVAAREKARQYIDRNRSDLTLLAIKIAEKILGEALRLEPKLVEQIVSECLKEAGEAHSIAICVNPVDLTFIEDALCRLGEQCESQSLVAVADRSIPRGGCMIETELGQLDGRIESQLEAIRKALSEAE